MVSHLDDLRGVALLQSGAEIVVEIAAGTTGNDPVTACTRRTRFQLGSVSKQFTAAAVLLLADLGELSLNDPVSRWLDGPPAWESVTVHHLLTHTAGLAHWNDIPDLDLPAPIEPEQELAIFYDAPLRSAPGDRWYYSSPGYALLAHVAQRVSGQPYRTFLAEQIFDPLGMTSTFAGNGTGADIARGHRGGKEVPSFELDVVGMGAGDIWSTAADLARWDRALAEGEILSASARNAMLSVHAEITEPILDGVVGDVQGYGYGWFLGTSSSDRRVVFHPGGNSGFLAFNGWFRDDDTLLVVLTNEETTNLPGVIKELLARVSQTSA